MSYSDGAVYITIAVIFKYVLIFVIFVTKIVRICFCGTEFPL